MEITCIIISAVIILLAIAAVEIRLQNLREILKNILVCIDCIHAEISISHDMISCEKNNENNE